MGVSILKDKFEKNKKKINLTLKRRYADGRNKSNDILEKDFKNKKFDNEDFKGNISLLTVKKVREEWKVDDEQRCI